jgi:hypothetical protein
MNDVAVHGSFVSTDEPSIAILAGKELSVLGPTYYVIVGFS